METADYGIWAAGGGIGNARTVAISASASSSWALIADWPLTPDNLEDSSEPSMEMTRRRSSTSDGDRSKAAIRDFIACAPKALALLPLATESVWLWLKTSGGATR